MEMRDNRLTQRQDQFLTWITDHFRQYGKAPTFQELGDHFGMKAPSAFDVVNALIKKGYLARTGKGPYSTLDIIDEFGATIEANKLPLIGEVAAGIPLLAVENRIGSLTIDERLLQRGATFALKVKGDSMIEAGILHGDFVIIKPQSTAINGDIVLALVGEEATIKHFYQQNGVEIRLRPANSTMFDIIVPVDQCQIQGKVIAVQREIL